MPLYAKYRKVIESSLTVETAAGSVAVAVMMGRMSGRSSGKAWAPPGPAPVGSEGIRRGTTKRCGQLGGEGLAERNAPKSAPLSGHLAEPAHHLIKVGAHMASAGPSGVSRPGALSNRPSSASAVEPSEPRRTLSSPVKHRGSPLSPQSESDRAWTVPRRSSLHLDPGGGERCECEHPLGLAGDGSDGIVDVDRERSFQVNGVLSRANCRGVHASPPCADHATGWADAVTGQMSRSGRTFGRYRQELLADDAVVFADKEQSVARPDSSSSVFDRMILVLVVTTSYWRWPC